MPNYFLLVTFVIMGPTAQPLNSACIGVTYTKGVCSVRRVPDERFSHSSAFSTEHYPSNLFCHLRDRRRLARCCCCSRCSHSFTTACASRAPAWRWRTAGTTSSSSPPSPARRGPERFPSSNRRCSPLLPLSDPVPFRGPFRAPRQTRALLLHHKPRVRSPAPRGPGP